MNLFSGINISSIIGDILSGLIVGFFTYLGVKTSLKFEKQKYKRELMKEKFNNKPEFRVLKTSFKADEEADIVALCTNFNHYFDENGKIIIDYNSEILDKQNLVKFDYEFKNIGKSSSVYTVVATPRQQNTSLIEMDSLEFFYNNKTMNYACFFDKKILPNEILKLRIYYHKNSGPISIFSSNLILMFQDESGNYWEQPFFEDKCNLYSPSMMTYKDFKIYTTIDTALDCFKEPWRW